MDLTLHDRNIPPPPPPPLSPRPLIFSEKEFTSRGVGWIRTGHDIVYLRNSYTRRVRRGAHNDCPTYFTLHYAMEFKHLLDRVYLTYSYPYTYTDLQNYLRALPETHPHLSDYFINQVFCKTLDNNVCNLLTITTLTNDSPVPIHERKVAPLQTCH